MYCRESTVLGWDFWNWVFDGITCLEVLNLEITFCNGWSVCVFLSELFISPTQKQIIAGSLNLYFKCTLYGEMLFEVFYVGRSNSLYIVTHKRFFILYSIRAEFLFNAFQHVYATINSMKWAYDFHMLKNIFQQNMV